MIPKKNARCWKISGRDRLQGSAFCCQKEKKVHPCSGSLFEKSNVEVDADLGNTFAEHAYSQTWMRLGFCLCFFFKHGRVSITQAGVGGTSREISQPPVVLLLLYFLRRTCSIAHAGV